MVLLVCPCLNVRVHGKGDSVNLKDPNKLNLPESLLTDSFFQNKVYAVFLDLAGLTMSQKELCKTRHNGDWIIITCVCCVLDVCAHNVKDNLRVLVSSKTEMNSNSISSLMTSERYSTLFKLVLPEINDNFIQNNFGNGFHDKILDSSIEQVQYQVSNFLRNEQKLMEDRIRKFTEEQQAGYTKLLQIVRKNKQAMVYLMTKCKGESDLSEDLPLSLPLQKDASSSFQDSELLKREPMYMHTDSANESSTSTDSVFNKSDPSEPTSLMTHNTTEKRLSALKRTTSNPGQSRSVARRGRHRASSNLERRHVGSVDVGGVFPMDVLEVAEHPPYLSYSETDTGESENEEKSEDAAEVEISDDAMYATSLPLSIPAFPQMSRANAIENDMEEPIPADIAASMRALACSVRDGTEMFGELPRRRLNTGELLAFKPPI